MLFVVNNYNAQFNAYGMNNMGLFRCHFRPLSVCGTTKIKIDSTSTTTTTATSSVNIVTPELRQNQSQQQALQQYDFESFRVLAGYKNFPLIETIVNVADITYPNNVRNDISASVPSFRNYKRQQNTLRRELRRNLLRKVLKRHFKTNCWHRSILLAI